MRLKLHLFLLWTLFLPGFLRSTGRSTGLLRLSPPDPGDPGRRARSTPPTSGPGPAHRPGTPGTPVRDSGSLPVDPGLLPVDPGLLPVDSRSLPVDSNVSVTCSAEGLVLRVSPGFFGLGAGTEELRLGSCRSNGVLHPTGDLLFTYPVTACDGERELQPGFLVYKFKLLYEPSPKRFPSRAHRISVDVECRYPRNHHVFQLAVRPTWETFVVRKRLKTRAEDFRILLMDASWSGPAHSGVYQLGETINLQVSAPFLPPGSRLYISSCSAAPSSAAQPPLKYNIIDNSGCLLDSKRDPGASQFVWRSADTLRFTMMAFQFTSDPDAQVAIHCRLIVSADGPDSAHKSCTYTGSRWNALAGDHALCDCCDSHCVTSKARRATIEGSASSESLMVSDEPHMADDLLLPANTRRRMRVKVSPHQQEALWGRREDGGEEKQQEERGMIPGVKTEPDANGRLEEGWSLSEEAGSAYQEQGTPEEEERIEGGEKIEEGEEGEEKTEGGEEEEEEKTEGGEEEERIEGGEEEKERMGGEERMVPSGMKERKMNRGVEDEWMTYEGIEDGRMMNGGAEDGRMMNRGVEDGRMMYGGVEDGRMMNRGAKDERMMNRGVEDGRMMYGGVEDGRMMQRRNSSSSEETWYFTWQ